MKTIFLLALLALTWNAFASEVIEQDGRRYTFISPAKTKKPLLVVLHGCKQSPDLIVKGTGLDVAAQKYGFAVLAPEQTIFDNIDYCWNWFMTNNQSRNIPGEASKIMAMVEFIIRTKGIDRERVYLTGLSAGGVMSHNLSVCYPDVFAGVAIHSGLTYKVAESMYEAGTVLNAAKLKSPNYLGLRAFQCAGGAHKRRLTRMLMIHGDLDKRVDPYHSELISKTNEVWFDYLDDGKRNHSQVRLDKTTELTFPNGYAGTHIVKDYSSPKFREEFYLIKGLAHAWGGAKAITENFDPDAPSSTEFILNFLQLKK